ncbi:MAG: thioredoxin family protein [Proteobacteria bacterium]|nr:thioredoxin family protein [Pseudomonadota bacterium]
MSNTPILTELFGSLVNFWQLLVHIDAQQIKTIASEHTWLAVLLCFASGILTSLTPCVYPMIPITINIFGRASQKQGKLGKVSAFNLHTFFLSCIYVTGMAVTYSIMGLIAGMTGSLFGKVLQSSYMLGFLTLLFLGLAIGQWGFFKIALPVSWQNKLAKVGDAESLPGIFLMGLFSGLIVSPCVGPVIAGILAFVFDTSNAWRGCIYFLSFSLGLGVLFLLIGGFSGMLAGLPRSGNWMVRVNRVLATLMVLASAYYGSLWYKKINVGSPKSVVTLSAIHWLSNEIEAAEKAKALNKPIFIDFAAEWCEACHVIEKTVFTDAAVAAELNSRFITLRIDVTESNEINEQILQKYGVLSLPTLVFVSPNGTILKTPRVHGVITAKEFLQILKTHF